MWLSRPAASAQMKTVDIVTKRDAEEVGVVLPMSWDHPAPSLWASSGLPPLFEQWTYDEDFVYQ